MKRRAFITGLGSAVAWPVVTRGQENAKVWRVGYLSPASAFPVNVALLDAFRIKLQDLGYVGYKLRRLAAFGLGVLSSRTPLRCVFLLRAL